MSDKQLSTEQIQAAIAHMNQDHRENLVAYAHLLAGAPWSQTATLAGLDAEGFDLVVEDGSGRRETHRLLFPEPVHDLQQLRLAFIQLAQQTAPPDGLQRAAAARVVTPRASRYLKALCNHFDRKAEAAYDDHFGRVQFPFGECELEADETTLHIRVVAESETMLNRTKHVVADHLERFATRENVRVDWLDSST